MAIDSFRSVRIIGPFDQSLAEPFADKKHGLDIQMFDHRIVEQKFRFGVESVHCILIPEKQQKGYSGQGAEKESGISGFAAFDG